MRLPGHGAAVVLDGHTLGVPIGDDIQILHTSVLRGSPIQGDPLSAMGTLPLPMDRNRLRPATKQDFDDFRVMWNPDYTYPDDVVLTPM